MASTCVKDHAEACQRVAPRGNFRVGPSAPLLSFCKLLCDSAEALRAALYRVRKAETSSRSQLSVKTWELASALHMFVDETLKSEKVPAWEGGQRCLGFVIRGGGDAAVICLHPGSERLPLQVNHQSDAPHPPTPLATRSGTRDGWAWRAAAQLLETLTKEMMFFFLFFSSSLPH